jgi:uncharacterized protein (DUF924 family)
MNEAPDSAIDDVLSFWFEEIEQSRWFKADPQFDKEIEQRFSHLLVPARNDQLGHWCVRARGYLALIVVLDQFSRNIHRGTPLSFDGDSKALQLCVDGIEKKFDRQLSTEQRSFFYLPLRHAEDLAMQKLGLEKTREINAEGYGSDKYALSHLALIERFGRFPHRNSILGRRNTSEEDEYLKDGPAGF